MILILIAKIESDSYIIIIIVRFFFYLATFICVLVNFWNWHLVKEEFDIIANGISRISKKHYITIQPCGSNQLCE